MFAPSLSALRDTADQLVVLAGTFQLSSEALKAQHIRRAEKTLVTLEVFFTENVALEGKQWLRASEGLAVLRSRLQLVQQKDAEIESTVAEIANLENSMQQWLSLPDVEREKILQQAKSAKHYIDNRMFVAEAHILHKFQRYDALKSLVPFADNADYLCEAIHHFENRHKYEESITRLEIKKQQALERLGSVKRGFYLAVFFCIFLVTMPLCVPFAISLWSRRREIYSQIANVEETIRRENRRLEAAEEGAVASQEIRDLLGDVPIEQVKRTLTELKDLRSEFQRPQKTSLSAGLLAFVDLYRPRLNQFFGELPSDPVEVFRWLVAKTAEAQHIKLAIENKEAQKEELLAQRKALLKGHSLEILKHSIKSLEKITQETFLVSMSTHAKVEFAKLCLDFPRLLTRTREVLSLISHGQSVDSQYFENLHTELQSSANLFNMSVLEGEISEIWGDSIGEPDCGVMLKQAL